MGEVRKNSPRGRIHPAGSLVVGIFLAALGTLVLLAPMSEPQPFARVAGLAIIGGAGVEWVFGFWTYERRELVGATALAAATACAGLLLLLVPVNGSVELSRNVTIALAMRAAGGFFAALVLRNAGRVLPMCRGAVDLALACFLFFLVPLALALTLPITFLLTVFSRVESVDIAIAVPASTLFASFVASGAIVIISGLRRDRLGAAVSKR